MRNNTWQLQHAKARLSAVLRAAENWPQTITVRGRAKAVVMPVRMVKSMLAEIRQLRAAVAPPGEDLEKG